MNRVVDPRKNGNGNSFMLESNAIRKSENIINYKKGRIHIVQQIFNHDNLTTIHLIRCIVDMHFT